MDDVLKNNIKMAAYNLNYPIYAEVNYTLISQALKYVYYRIRASYPGSQAGMSRAVIANGRSFVDSTGSTKIRLDQILKDYTFRWEVKWDNPTQRFIPKIFDPYPSVEDIWYPVEKNILGWSGSFQNTNINVQYSADNADWVDISNINVIGSYYTGLLPSPYDSENPGISCGPYNEIYQRMNNLVHRGIVYTYLAWDDQDIALWDDEDEIEVSELGWITVVPHVPNVHSSNFPLSCMYWLDRYEWRSVNMSFEIYIPGQQDKVSLSPWSPGNYAFSIPLSSIIPEGGTTAQTIRYYYGQYTHPTNVRHAEGDLAIIDQCPADYYLLWVNDYNDWFSWGFKGTETLKRKQTTIENFEDRTMPWKADLNSAWSLHSSYVDQWEIEQVKSIIRSNNILLYDTKHDKIIPVFLNSNSIDLYKNGKRKLYSLQVNVEEQRKLMKL